MDPDREADILARTAEILAAKPTPEELAEQAERARRNKVERIMRSPARSRGFAEPPVVRKVNDSALVQPRASSGFSKFAAATTRCLTVFDARLAAIEGRLKPRIRVPAGRAEL